MNIKPYEKLQDDTITIPCPCRGRGPRCEQCKKKCYITAQQLAFSLSDPNPPTKQITAIKSAFKTDAILLHKTPREIIASLRQELAREKSEKQQFVTALNLALSHLPLHIIDAVEATLELIYGHGHDSVGK